MSAGVDLRILQWKDRLFSSLWFLPSVMAVAAVGLAWSMPGVDRLIQSTWGGSYRFVSQGDVEGARAVLATIAGSMITVAGVVFSVTIVALTLASSQFGPRLLRNFMRDTGNQFVLGTFIATFLYCLSLLKQVQGRDEADFIPHLSIGVGMFLALCSIGVLIYFMHHISASMQAHYVVQNVVEEIDEAIERLYPERLGEEPIRRDELPGTPEDVGGEAGAVCVDFSEYIEQIDVDALLRLAVNHDMVFRLQCRPGDFLAEGMPLLDGRPATRLDDDMAEQVRACFIHGATRTPIQDAGFCVDQLVEIAVRALSPGINDPFTAILCIDRLSAILRRLAERKFPDARRYDEEQNLRVLAPLDQCDDIIADAFNQIRQHGRGNTAVSIRLLEAIRRIIPIVRRRADLDALAAQAAIIANQDAGCIPDAFDREDLAKRYESLKQMIDEVEQALAARLPATR